MGVASARLQMLYRSTIGRKVIMSITGLIGLGFVVGHMYGNLKVFGGAAYFNEYAEGLRALGEPVFGHTHLLWIFRVVLLGAVILHVWSAWTLYQDSTQARAQQYKEHKKLQANYASLTMRYGGIILFFFILYHLAHFTWGVPGIHPNFVYGDAYNNLVIGFQSYYYLPAVFYLIAVAALGFHLYHGTWSAFQTLGLNSKEYSLVIRGLAITLALVISIGFAVVPLAVMLGILTTAG